MLSIHHHSTQIKYKHILNSFSPIRYAKTLHTVHGKKSSPFLQFLWFWKNK